MIGGNQDLTASASYASVTVIALLTIPSLWRLLKRSRRVKTPNEPALYEDEDGVATEESMARFSFKWHFFSIFVVASIGLATSLGLAVVATVRREHAYSAFSITQTWLLFPSWILLFLQLLDTVLEKDVVARFYRGATNLIACGLTFTLGWTVILGEIPSAPDSYILLALAGVQVIASFTIAGLLFFIHRRPDVFAPDGRLVERRFTRSLWHNYTFSWGVNVLDEAAQKNLDMKDLPALDSYTRSKDASKSFRSIILKDSTPLWILISWRLRWTLLWQWLVIAISCFFDVGPQFAMLQILRYLEGRRGGAEAIDPRAWLWVLVMFAITFGSTILDHRILWSMFADIAIPTRSVLTTLLFEKVMRLKDIKEATKSDNDDQKETPTANGVDKSPKENAAKPEKKGRQTQQEVVNMFTVDTNLIAMFTANQQMYLNFAMRFILAIAFLWLLVGWKSMLAGMVSMAVTFPINQKLGQRYGTYQKALMKARDKKTAVITEALNGIRQIKFSAIETQWSQKLEDVREDELKKLWQAKLATVVMGLASDMTPVLFAVFALATYSYLEGDLLPSIAFTALSLFIQLEGLTGMLPYLLTMGVNAKVSVDRIDKFLQQPEREQNTFPGEAVSFYKASITFPSNSIDDGEERFTLRDITLDFPNNALSVISGPTGAGKSLLLAAILGEAEVLSGNIRVPRPPPVEQRFDSKATAADWIIPSAIAFISQTPWIENATIKDNILFGLPDDKARYEKVIKACSLTKDLAMFDDGDQTEVGAQGISLSGGQKWRLTLARAFYSRAGILILDDVFSALDAHVGKAIYDNALMGELSEGRTRILCTHHVSLCLPRAKYAVRLGARGTLEHAGFVDELKQSGSFEEILKAGQAELETESASADELESSGTTLRDEVAGAVEVTEEVSTQTKSTPKKLVEEEKRETGSVKSSVYKEYLSATGGAPFWGFVLFVYIGSQVLSLGRSWWVKIWTSSYERVQSEMTSQAISIGSSYASSMQSQLMTWWAMVSVAPFQELHTAVTTNNVTFRYDYTEQTQISHHSYPDTAQVISLPAVSSKLTYYLGVYVAISLASILASAFRFYFVYRGGLAGSRRLFREMTNNVLRTPLRWLDTVPTGRILNRFTGDFMNIDSLLSMNFANLAACALEMVGVLTAAFIISPYMVILSLLLLGICGQMGRRYLRGARSIKRLESIQKSPMISLFSSSLDGLSTIRAFGNAGVFVDRMYVLIDGFATATFMNWLFNTWIGFRMAMVGSIFSSVVAAFVVTTRGVDASLAGFALAFSLDFRHAAQRTVRLFANTELDMNAAERVFEYSHIEIENQDGIDNLRASWPEEGKLEVKDLEVGYAADLPAILKGLTFSADSNQRIGVVGRTGAGKSTLSLALFRFLEARKGSICIDGVDISTVKLHDLRTRLAIIPQDPVLFSGTIRSNLDPFDEFSDHQVKEVLSRVHLTPSLDSTPIPELATSSEASSDTAAPDGKANVNIFLDLSSPISSSGTNLSQGQKQLLCLARAILSRPRLLILDEATSAVDMVTDALIQRSIREEFANTTLLVVAHRLSTVADFDRILVMHDGVAAEFGSPKTLMGIEDGVFKGMVGQSGEKEELEATILASES